MQQAPTTGKAGTFFGMTGDEIPPFALLFVLGFSMRAAFLFFQNFAETTFVSRYGVENLPRVLLITAVVSSVVLTILSRLVDRFRRTVFMGAALVATCGLWAWVWSLAMAEVTWVYPVAYVLSSQVDVVLTLSFWLLANELFDARQAKRLFPRLAAGAILGAMLASFLTPVVSRYLGVEYLLVLASSVAGGCAAYVLIFHRRLSSIRGTVFRRKTPRHLAGMGGLLKHSLLFRVLIALVLFPAILEPIIDYQFMYLAGQRYGEEQSLVAFWGTFKGGLSVIQFILQVFLAGALFVRLGLSRVFFVMPVNSVALFTSLASRFTLGVGLYARISTDILQSAFHEPAKQAMYAFFPEDIRGRVSMFVRSLASRTGAIVGSGMLMVLVPLLTQRWMNLVAVAVATAGVVAAWYFKHNYHRLVVGSISSRHVDFSVPGVVDVQGLVQGEDGQEDNPLELKKRLDLADLRQAEHLVKTLALFASPGIDTGEYLHCFSRQTYRVATDLAVMQRQEVTEEGALFVKALTEFLDGGRRTLLQLAVMRMELSRAQALVKAALSPDPKELALALEALEGAVPRRLRPVVMPIFERREPYRLAVIAGEHALAVGHDVGTVVKRWWRSTDNHIAFCASLLTDTPGLSPQGESMKELLTTPEKLVFLRKVSIFESLTIPELTAIGRITEEKDWRAGAHIFKEGEFGSTMYLVADGSVEIYKKDLSSPLATLTKGAFFGEMALLEKRERSASARVPGPTRTLCIHGYEFEELMKEHPSIPIKICAVLSHRLREAMG